VSTKLAPNLALGQAGTHRVLAELLLRGINAGLPVVDDGVDIFTTAGLRLQVKARRLTTRRSKDLTHAHLGPAYRFTLSVRYVTDTVGRTTFKRQNKPTYVTTRKYSDEVDYLVFWGVDEDRFWVIPASECDGKLFLSFYPQRSPVAENPNSANGQLRLKYEGRWDLLVPPSTEAIPQLRVVGE
jgi:hypothetical protein